MGIQKELIKEGTGPIPQRGQMVTVHCTGMGKNRDLNVKFWRYVEAFRPRQTSMVWVGGTAYLSVSTPFSFFIFEMATEIFFSFSFRRFFCEESVYVLWA